jgi:hypothetical protein
MTVYANQELKTPSWNFARDRKTFRQIQDLRQRSDAMRFAPPAGGGQ